MVSVVTASDMHVTRVHVEAVSIVMSRFTTEPESGVKSNQTSRTLKKDITSVKMMQVVHFDFKTYYRILVM